MLLYMIIFMNSPCMGTYVSNITNHNCKVLVQSGDKIHGINSDGFKGIFMKIIYMCQ